MNQSNSANRSCRRLRAPGRRARLVLDDASIGRIEAWVVSTLGDPADPSPDRDWRESPEDFEPMVRTQPGRVVDLPRATPLPGPWARFRLAHKRGVAVVSLTDSALIREDDLAELAGDLEALVAAGHSRIVLDLHAVERISSLAARTIDQAVRACRAWPGGAVKLSRLRPEVATIFALVGLDASASVLADTASAIVGPWPDRPSFRPLPVSILAALCRAEDSRSRRGLDPAGRAPEETPAMLTARLIVQDGPYLGQAIPIPGGGLAIGRGPGCQLRIGSTLVSRSHARIEPRGRRFFLRDLGSTNGSIVNGRPLREAEVEVADGDLVRFGPVTFAIAVGPESVRGVERDHRPAEEWPDGNEAFIATEESTRLDHLAGFPGLKHEVVQGVLVVTPTTSDLDDPTTVDAFREALVTLLEVGLSRRVVVNLAHVGQLSGRAIGVLVAHQLRLDRSGGALRVGASSPRVALVLEQVKLGMFIQCHASADEAIIAAWPETVVGSN